MSSTTGRRSDSSSCARLATHDVSLRTVGEFIGLQFGLVGFVMLPVVLSGVTLTAWARLSQARAGRDPAVDIGCWSPSCISAGNR